MSFNNTYYNIISCIIQLIINGWDSRTRTYKATVKVSCVTITLCPSILERTTGLEPAQSSAWKADVLANYTTSASFI